jgi:predicted component of type VI protein secretion system
VDANFCVSDDARMTAPDDEAPPPNVFRVVVASELLARPEWSTTATPPRRLFTLGREGGLDALFATLGPRIAFDIRDPWTATTSRVDLAFRSLRSFRPAEIAEQVPLVRMALEAATVVAKSSGTAAFDLERLLPACNTTAELVRKLAPRTGGGLVVPSARGAGASAATSGGDGLDSFFSLLDEGGGADENAATAPATSVSGEGHDERNPLQILEARLASLLDQILNFPELRRLERGWRGLAWLLAETPPSSVEFWIYPLGGDDADALSEAITRGEGPVDLIVVDDSFENNANDADRLAALASLGEGHRAPVVTGATADLVGSESIDAVARTRGSFVSRGEAGNAVLRSIAGKDAARWLCLVLGRVLGRAPWDAATARLRGVTYRESADPPFLNGAFAVAIACARSAVALGLGADPTDDRACRIGNLPVWLVGEGEHVEALSAERSLPSDVADDLARAGITTLTSAKNRDEVRVERAAIVFRGAELGPGMAPPARMTLSDQLFVGKLSRALDEVASAIPRGTDEAAIREVVLLSLHPLFLAAPPRAPELSVALDHVAGHVVVTVRPRRYAGTRLEELELRAHLGRS